ncbi:DUF1801 domain-containing protein [Roseovarius faecimaris]|uniref:DUF1801 domain-containing protein n=1 Tax=Roseovarius faecimaris TaxID=2494550 RepID=A0A6I6IU02_9RHOB|nr:DUF1801 domain-containing protein [Roseovarius faecimaris]QGX99251.1 DUF1801 domain-containing protein [Roseovarius faecimaris]
MTENKTKPGNNSPEAFLKTVQPDQRRRDGGTLLQLFREVTGFEPVMWGASMIGFGRYHYVYDSGREDDFLATGFSPRKANLSIYIMPGYQDYSEILGRLGKHKLGKSCLYVTRLDQIDLDVLAELIRAGLADLDKRWLVLPA